MQEYEAIAEKYPYFPEAQFYMGLTKFRQKDIEGAAFYFSEALKIYPDHQKARKGLNNVTKQFLNNGNKAYKRGDLEKATQYYLKTIQFDKQYYLAYFQLGVLEKKMGNPDQAIAYLNKAIELVYAAKEVGANAIKLQTYTADTLTLNHKSKEFFIN